MAFESLPDILDAFTESNIVDDVKGGGGTAEHLTGEARGESGYIMPSGAELIYENEALSYINNIRELSEWIQESNQMVEYENDVSESGTASWYAEEMERRAERDARLNEFIDMLETIEERGIPDRVDIGDFVTRVAREFDQISVENGVYARGYDPREINSGS